MTKKEVEKLSDILSARAEQPGNLKEQLKEHDYLIKSVLIVLLVMVAALLFDFWNERKATFQSLVNQINIQTATIEGIDNKLDLIFTTMLNDERQRTVPTNTR